MPKARTTKPERRKRRRLSLTMYSADEKKSLEGRVVNLSVSGELVRAGHRARRLQRERGVPLTQTVGSRVVKVYPDGREEVLGRVKKVSYTLPKGVTVISNQ